MAPCSLSQAGQRLTCFWMPIWASRAQLCCRDRLDAMLGDARLATERPFSAFKTWGTDVCFRCPREICQQVQPVGMVTCLNCFADFTTRAFLPSRPGQLAAAARSVEQLGDVVAKAPPALSFPEGPMLESQRSWTRSCKDTPEQPQAGPV